MLSLFFFVLKNNTIIVKYTIFWNMQIFQGKFNLFLLTYCIYEKNVLSLYQEK
jgi:hypothetical protein